MIAARANQIIVLDTHVWLWLLHDLNRLSANAREAVSTAEPSDGLYVSAISVWEIAVKTKLGKLFLPYPIDEWFEMACQHSGIVIEPVTASDAIASTQLPEPFHKDPGDRMIIALAQRYRAPLSTYDQNILAYPHVKTIW